MKRRLELTSEICQETADWSFIEKNILDNILLQFLNEIPPTLLYVSKYYRYCTLAFHHHIVPKKLFMSYFASFNNLDLYKWCFDLIDDSERNYNKYFVTKTIVKSGNLEIFQWLMSKISLDYNQCYDSAAKSGHIHILNELWNAGIYYKYFDDFYRRATCNNIEIINWGLSKKFVFDKNAMLYFLIHGGQKQERFALLLENKLIVLTREDQEYILLNVDDKSILEWLIQKKYLIIDNEMMKFIAEENIEFP